MLAGGRVNTPQLPQGTTRIAESQGGARCAKEAKGIQMVASLKKQQQ